jgi:outer membrane protein OmpA-like peptidoglycan-associated protein
MKKVVRTTAWLAGTLAAGVTVASPSIAAGNARAPHTSDNVLLAQAPSPDDVRKKREDRREERRDNRQQHREQRNQNRDQRAQPQQPPKAAPKQQPAQAPQRAEPPSRPQRPAQAPERVRPPDRPPQQPAQAPQRAQPPQQPQRPAQGPERGQPPQRPAEAKPDARPAGQGTKQPTQQGQRPDTRPDGRPSDGRRGPDRADGPGSRPQQGARNVDELRRQRRERVESGGRRIIEEPDRRVIVRENNRTIIRHDDNDRFRRFDRNARVERRGNEIRTVIVRPNGVRVIVVTDNNGRLLRRVRVLPGGREVILIDNTRHGGPGGVGFFLDVPPPRITIPRERYYVRVDDGRQPDFVAALTAPPLVPIERAYTLDEIRYNPNLVARMPRIVVNTINFELGSWEVPQDQAAKLEAIANAINAVLKRNPNAVMMIAGHTDATGADVDNLSLSDRRAEAVAVILTEAFGVPPENLVTQGYGEQQLLVDTQGANADNRRVEIVNVTPFLTGKR